MRLTDLLGSSAVQLDGKRLGHIHDVRLIQDGPPIGVWGAALRLDSLLVGPSAVGARLGFDRGEVEAPWALSAAFRRLHRRLVEIPVEDMLSIEQGCVHVAARSDRRHPGLPQHGTGRRIDAGLSLLDRQIIDVDGFLTGNVDDLGLRFVPGGAGSPRIVVDDILVGPGALARRLGGRLGRTVGAIHDVLQDHHLEGPASISFGVVSQVDQAVHVTVSREGLTSDNLERWTRDHLIARLPGS